jgi:hypothetical protein
VKFNKISYKSEGKLGRDLAESFQFKVNKGMLAIVIYSVIR